MIYVLFLCMVAPLVLSIPLIKKSSRSIMVFILIGIALALFVSEVNALFLELLSADIFVFTTTVTPVTEELVKAIPILIYAFVFTDKRGRLVTASFAVGIGFALFENTYILTQTTADVTVAWALVRGFSTALMHGICTAALGYGMSFIRKKQKLFYCGTIALMLMAITYHGIFNMLVQNESLKYFGFFLPAVTYIPFVIIRLKNVRKDAASEQAEKTQTGE